MVARVEHGIFFRHLDAHQTGACSQKIFTDGTYAFTDVDGLKFFASIEHRTLTYLYVVGDVHVDQALTFLECIVPNNFNGWRYMDGL